MRIAVEGCAHGCLEEIYRTIEDIEKRHDYKVDLLLCCGDFQSVRNLVDLKTMACPDKFKATGSFYKYHTGELKAPILTLFIGGNHEASNYLQELPYGGWVAPNIYFLGKASVVNVGGIRIGGLSGIYKSRDYNTGHFEHLPYSERTLRSVYHLRNLEVFRMKQLSASPPDILLSHDWPCGITDHGNVEQLLRWKPFFRKDIEANALGSPPCMELLQILKPQYWFSGHLHVKFSALVKHKDSELETKFLALDKCLPKRRFLQIIDVPNNDCGPLLSHDPKWLAILRSTNDLLSVSESMVHMPGPGYNGRYDYSPTSEEIEYINKLFNNDFVINANTFTQSTKDTFQRPDQVKKDLFKTKVPSTPVMNAQTTSLCDKLEIHDPVRLAMEQKSERVGIKDLKDFEVSQQKVQNEDEIILSDEEESPLKEPEEKLKEQTHSPNKSDNESFFIDTTPLSLTESTNDEEPKSKKRLIKRRNKSIYDSLDE